MKAFSWQASTFSTLLPRHSAFCIFSRSLPEKKNTKAPAIHDDDATRLLKSRKNLNLARRYQRCIAEVVRAEDFSISNETQTHLCRKSAITNCALLGRRKREREQEKAVERFEAHKVAHLQHSLCMDAPWCAIDNEFRVLSCRQRF